MLCIYCMSQTSVTNSRLQRRDNGVWRRRKCADCGKVFTTNETANLETSLNFAGNSGRPQPFSHAALLVSVYESCKHRPDAPAYAAEVTKAITGKLISSLQGRSTVNRSQLIDLTVATLKHFDKTAATVYAAYHPVKN